MVPVSGCWFTQGHDTKLQAIMMSTMRLYWHVAGRRFFALYLKALSRHRRCFLFWKSIEGTFGHLYGILAQKNHAFCQLKGLRPFVSVSSAIQIEIHFVL
jgi:hypothetical protein